VQIRVSLPRGFGRSIVRTLAATVLLLPAYALLAYVVLPVSWSGYERLARHADPGITRTAEGIPGDPLNVALIGDEAEVLDAMLAAGWTRADPIGWRSGIRDAASILFNRPYASAPMSTDFFENRPQDLAFEQVAGRSPRARHHVRLWRLSDSDGARSTWIGSATFDRRIGLSHYTAEVTHRIDANVDAERGKLFSDLEGSGRLARVECAKGLRPRGRGVNGSGDAYVTDGRLCVGVLGAP
jgi:hypothetical protein